MKTKREIALETIVPMMVAYTRENLADIAIKLAIQKPEIFLELNGVKLKSSSYDAAVKYLTDNRAYPENLSESQIKMVIDKIDDMLDNGGFFDSGTPINKIACIKEWRKHTDHYLSTAKDFIDHLIKVKFGVEIL